MRGAALVAIATLAAAGCSGAPGPIVPGTVTLTLGSADVDGSGFIPLAGDLTLVPGGQGGFHIWLKYRVTGMAPARATVDRQARRASDGTLILTTSGTVDVGEPDAAGYWELPTAVPSFMCPTPIGVSVIDERVTFDVALSDDAGHPLAKATATATVHCPTDGQASHCQAICAG
jgi:hypothetical protein